MNRLKDEVDEPETIVDRLRGIYVNKVGEYPSAEPPYKTSPIMQEAARRIEELQAEVESVNHFASMLRSECNRHRETIDSMNKQLVHCGGVISKGDKEIERLRGDLATYDWSKLSRKKCREIGNLELEQD